ncbi:uroporphyrinogen-III C-methyltransferase [Ectobacillus panaciterrae]|uniref:uroporphyrinogen-III C-methyltransferase n=1 Tax=Ectobacillus panaciterrae TaxID=363872 RepID=UPI00041C9EFD|nr:uroporphyrinogen-III C-methyltransferase [Ectobacillus panaciterrae]
MKKGKVFLVGAGPGDIGLITVRGLEAIKLAEVILYDRLANPKLLEFAPLDCELIYCGKLPHCHALRQDKINDLLVEKALEGKIVVRLKGGDPSVFGRVGEEAAALAEHDISFEIVPGITSGIAAPLYAGIPVTHREYGGSFAIVTAHDKSKEGKPSIDWEGLVNGIDTISFYMGVANLPFICESLIKHGKPSSTPVILVQWGTFGRQKILEGTLETIVQKAQFEKFENPAITLIGDIVSIRGKLNWFEKKPLFGRQILLARTGTEISEIAKELTEQGADVIEFPKWKKVSAPVDMTVMRNIHMYEKILFTSPESVTDFFTTLAEQEIDIRNVKAKLFGGSTKSTRELKKRGFVVDVADKMTDCKKLLIVGDDQLQKHNTEYTAQYGVHDLFITSFKQIDEQFIPILQRMLDEAALDTVVFPSSAAVQAFVEQAPVYGITAERMLRNLKIVCMGKKTWAAAETFGLNPDDMPENPTRQALIECLQKTFISTRL